MYIYLYTVYIYTNQNWYNEVFNELVLLGKSQRKTMVFAVNFPQIEISSCRFPIDGRIAIGNSKSKENFQGI